MENSQDPSKNSGQVPFLDLGSSAASGLLINQAEVVQSLWLSGEKPGVQELPLGSRSSQKSVECIKMISHHSGDNFS